MALNRTWLDAHVKSAYIPILVDNIFTGVPLLTKLMSKNKVMLDSGQNIRVPILYGMKKGDAFSGLDRFDINPVKTRQSAQWEWKSFYTNVTIIGEEVMKIEGTEKIIPLVENEIKEAEMKMKDMLGGVDIGVLGDGTGSSSKAIDGLNIAISASAYGDITPSDLGSNSTNKIWESTVDATGGAVTLSKIKGYMGNCTYGTECPDLGITTQDVYDSLWGQLQPSQRFLNPASALAKIGFKGIEIDGMQILVDRHVPTGYFYGVNTDYFKFIVNKHRNFSWTEDKPLVDADAYVRQLLVACNLICTSRRYHFKATGLTA